MVEKNDTQTDPWNLSFVTLISLSNIQHIFKSLERKAYSCIVQVFMYLEAL